MLLYLTSTDKCRSKASHKYDKKYWMPYTLLIKVYNFIWLRNEYKEENEQEIKCNMFYMKYKYQEYKEYEDKEYIFAGSVY